MNRLYLRIANKYISSIYSCDYIIYTYTILSESVFLIYLLDKINQVSKDTLSVHHDKRIFSKSKVTSNVGDPMIEKLQEMWKDRCWSKEISLERMSESTLNLAATIFNINTCIFVESEV